MTVAATVRTRRRRRLLPAALVTLAMAACGTTNRSTDALDATVSTVSAAVASPSTSSGPARTTMPNGTPVSTGSTGSTGSTVLNGTAVAGFSVASPAFRAGGDLPARYTCDGASLSPPVSWSGAPAGTVAYAVVIHHVAAPDDVHWYWVLYDVPATVDHIDEGVTPPAKVGTNSVNGRSEYTPPCSKGPGRKVYTVTVYALSAPPALPNPRVVNRAVLLAAIADRTLAAASIDVSYARA